MLARIVDCGTIGGVVAAAWIACAWAAGAGDQLSWGGWTLLAVALVVTYGGIVECGARVVVRQDEGTDNDGKD